MTPAQKILIGKLLTGHSLRRMKRRGKTWYVIYDERVNPVMKVRSATVKGLDKFIDPKLKLWRKNKLGDSVLNLSTVRQLHGRTILKTMYKNRDQITDTGRLYKQRISKQPKKNIDEKNYSLF